MPGFVPKLIIGSMSAASNVRSIDRTSHRHRSADARQRASALSHSAPCGRHRPAGQIFERRVVGGDHAGTRAAFDGHVADRHASVHVEAANRRAGVFDDASGSTGRADLRDDVENDVLRGDAVLQLAGDSDLEVLRLALQQALAREHVADFRGADAEGQRTKRAVRRGMTVAAHDGLPRLRDAELRTDHVNDALLVAAEPVELYAEVAAVRGRAA